MRVQIEQQRFLNFSLEAGILYTDGGICGSLQVNRHLLVAVLAEIKLLLEHYAEANGKYEQLVVPADIDRDGYEEPEADLMGLLFLPPDNKTTNEKVESYKRVRKFGHAIAQTGRNLRAIAVEPKRLVWAAVDKDSFECMILKLENLNSFLITLLDSSQLRRLQDTMNTNYLEILQLRNDVVSLTTLVKALTPTAETQQKSLLENFSPENNLLSQTVAQETAAQEKRKNYLKQLVQIKIQSTILSQPNSKAMVASASNFISNPLPLSGFVSAEGALRSDTSQQRTNAIYQGSKVWIEWKDIPAGNDLASKNEEVGRRIGFLTDLLRFVKPDGFRAPPCLGFVKNRDSQYATRFGIVFEKPLIDGVQSDIITLRELLGQKPKPSLSTRISLCAVLARCVHSFHAVNWLHKALRADNIIFISSRPPDLTAPFVSGFELSRPSIIDQMTEKPGFDPSKDIYRHPNAQSSQMDGNYRKSYDIYSLSVVIIEIALWKHIENIVGLDDLLKAKPRALQEMQSWLLGKSALPPKVAETGPCLQQIASACGDAFRNVIERCLEADTVEKPEYLGEPETAISLRLQKVTEQDIVKELEHIAEVL